MQLTNMASAGRSRRVSNVNASDQLPNWHLSVRVGDFPTDSSPAYRTVVDGIVIASGGDAGRT